MIGLRRSLFLIFLIKFQRNDTDLGEIKVFRGKNNYKDMGRVISVDGDTGELKLFIINSHFYASH